jgi:hypothetical protein
MSIESGVILLLVIDVVAIIVLKAFVLASSGHKAAPEARTQPDHPITDRGVDRRVVEPVQGRLYPMTRCGIDRRECEAR